MPKLLERITERAPALDRLMANVDYLMTRTSSATDPQNPYAVVRQSGTVLPVNPWKFRVTLSGNQTLSHAVGIFVPFNVLTFDGIGGWDTANRWWVVPISGYYFVAAKANIIVPGALKWITLTCGITQNGAYINQGTQTNNGDFTTTTGAVAATAYDVVATDAFFFNAGDHVQLQVAQQNSAAGTMTLASGVNTYLTAHLISG